MQIEEVVYRSAECKTAEQADQYLQTHHGPHRYLAYKDIPNLIRQFVRGTRALDYGAGAGASSSFLYDLGFEVIGLDVSSNMLDKAKTNFPAIEFYSVESLIPTEDFDLVFSSFVLFELGCKEDIVQYLNKSASFLKKDGVFIGITGSEHLYSLLKNWLIFDGNFDENHNLQSGDVAKLILKQSKMEFYDYYWKKGDYLECFGKTNLKILQVHYPLGSLKDPYHWKDELSYSPFIIFIAKNSDKINENA